MARNVGTFYDNEIAMMEHELIAESDIGDFRPDDLQMFIMGVHAMAQRVIEQIRRKEF